MPKEQLYLDDDMRPADEPPEVPEIRDRIYAWLDAKDEQARASERTKAAADATLIALREHGLESHPYLDPKTGKRRFFVGDTTPRPKTMSARPGRDADDDEDDVGEEVDSDRPHPSAVFGEQDATNDVVEKRRVSRASVEKEIDPFAATRAKITTKKGKAK